jgi:NAD(P)H-dependent FMN reductase
MSADTPLRLAIIVGSNREGRFGPTVADWFLRTVWTRQDLAVDVIDLAELDLHTVLGRLHDVEGAKATAVLDAADAFVVITPEYNHSYPASLKSFIDLHSTEWQAKPVGFVSYGGMAGGLRAVEHLRQVFAELHTVTVRHTVSLHNPWGDFDADGNHLNPQNAETAAKSMIDQLSWWAHALRDARATRPYAA